tara:strand:+ start:2945 stop:3823 length:879 start_codon:yes stop_codon:yes gene_type:complete
MNKYLIFRTDRIGDFLISAILIKSIKRNDKNSHITVLASNKNYNYIKSFKLVDQVILLENTLINKLRLIKKLRSIFFEYIIIHDNKQRSFFISNFLKYEKKLYIKKKASHIEIIKDFISQLNFTFNEEDLDLLINRYFEMNLPNKDYIVFHFDEKWFKNEYIKNFINIEPNVDELINFLKLLSLKKKEKLIITTGVNTPKILHSLKFFLTKNDIQVYDNINFFYLEHIISNCKLLISCHGFSSHIAAACKIHQIDIIDKSYEYEKWTKHFRNYDYVYRNNFAKLKCEILNKL